MGLSRIKGSQMQASSSIKSKKKLQCRTLHRKIARHMNSLINLKNIVGSGIRY